MADAPQPDLTGRVVVLTGASRGIGRAAAGLLARLGATLVLVSRRREDVDAAAADVRARTGKGSPVYGMAADLSSMASVRDLAARIRDRVPAVHVLINNAGTVCRTRTVTIDGVETTFAVNHLAAFVLTHELLGPLRAAVDARVLNVSSAAHARARLDLQDLQLERGFSPMRAYANSKLANILFTYALARRLHADRIAVHALHPGIINTGLLASIVSMPLAWLVGRSPEQGAQTIVWLASVPQIPAAGSAYWVDCREARSSPSSLDEGIQERLWGQTAALAGLPG